MLTNSRDIKRRLEQEGWVVDRVTGSHHVFKHPRRPATIVLHTLRRTWAEGWSVISIGRQDWEFD